jgi:sugar O-acyltransferase (sialic acid O-acetyltransferase NeuD family)
MNAQALILFPCNGNALEALDCLFGAYRVVAFIDDDANRQGGMEWGIPVLGREALSRYPDARVLAVPGSPASYRTRRRLIESLGVDANRYAQVIHPSAQISPRATLGRNLLIMAGVVVTGNASVGDHVCVLPNSVIQHDARVDDGALIGANVTIAGGVQVSESCYIASGSTLMNGLRIGARSLVGLGSTVIRDVAPDTTVAGNPARTLPSLPQRGDGTMKIHATHGSRPHAD